MRHWGEQKTVLLGDSIVREQKVEFVQRCASKRRVHGLSDQEFTDQEVRELSLGSHDDVVFTHVGTNDVRQMRQNELIQCDELIQGWCGWSRVGLHHQSVTPNDV